MATIDDVAAAILTMLGPMTTKKLQKLVYYSQAWHLARNGVRLFPDEIQAWREGPVVRKLYDKHRTRYEIRTWLDGDPARLGDDELATVRWVAATYGGFSAESLSRMTHAESPWRVARGLVPEGEPSQAPISDDIMRNFYINQVVEPDIAVALVRQPHPVMSRFCRCSQLKHHDRCLCAWGDKKRCQRHLNSDHVLLGYRWRSHIAAAVLAAASSALEGIELDDAWQEELRKVADGTVTADELIQREIGQHLSDR